MDKLEGAWASEKEMIGFDFNGRRKQMIRLPSKKAKRHPGKTKRTPLKQ